MSAWLISVIFSIPLLILYELKEVQGDYNLEVKKMSYLHRLVAGIVVDQSLD